MGKVDFSTSLRQLESAIGALEASKSAAAVGQVLRRSAPQPPVYHIRPEELDAECVDAVFQYLNNALGNIWGEVQRQIPYEYLVVFVRLFSKSEVLKEAIKSAEVTVESSEGIMYNSCTIGAFLSSLIKRFVANLCLNPPHIDVKFNYLLDFTAATSKNQRRKMEDRVVCVPDLQLLYPQAESGISFFAVFDGHRGSECSDYAATHFLPNLITSAYFGSNKLEALKEACSETDQNFQRRSTAHNFTSGTTCVAALVTKNYIDIVSVGDSQAVLATSSQVTCVTSLHNTSNQAERDRIKDMGGFIIEANGMARVNGMLAVTRSLGDFSLRPFVTAEPELVRHERSGGEEFLILGSDGAFESVSAELCADTVRQCLKKDPYECGDSLIQLAKKRGSQDNISVIVVFLKKCIIRPDSVEST